MIFFFENMKKNNLIMIFFLHIIMHEFWFILFEFARYMHVFFCDKRKYMHVFFGDKMKYIHVVFFL